jgi:hypothetical protein
MYGQSKSDAVLENDGKIHYCLRGCLNLLKKVHK